MAKPRNFPNDAIQWHEGMLLAPQHFQQQDLRAAAMLHYRVVAANPFYWGLHQLEIDLHRLGNGEFYVSKAEGILPDGTPVYHDSSLGALTADLTSWTEQLSDGPQLIYLTLPKYIPGYQPTEGQGRTTSYEDPSVPNEADPGARPIVVPRLRVAPTLYVGSAPESHVGIPIAKVEFANEAFGLAEYDAPMLQVHSGTVIYQRCSAFARRLRNRAKMLDERQHQLSLADDYETASTLRRHIELLVAGLPTLEAVLRTGVSHPYSVYIALSQIMAPVAALVSGQVPPELAAYNHDDPRGSFTRMLDALDMMVARGTQENFAGYRFEFDKRLYHIQLRGAWTDGPMILAVQRRRGVSDEELTTWMSEALIGTRDKLDVMMRHRVLGLPRKGVDRFEELVPTRDTLLFSLQMDARFVTSGESLVVYNRDVSDEGARPSEIVLYVAKD